MPKYDESVIQEALADMPDRFVSQDWVKWFERRYGDLDLRDEKSVRNRLRRECVNCPQGRGRHARDGQIKVYRQSRGHFEKYRPERHGELPL
jgi:hypothetical protein